MGEEFRPYKYKLKPEDKHGFSQSARIAQNRWNGFTRQRIILAGTSH